MNLADLQREAHAIAKASLTESLNPALAPYIGETVFRVLATPTLPAGHTPKNYLNNLLLSAILSAVFGAAGAFTAYTIKENGGWRRLLLDPGEDEAGDRVASVGSRKNSDKEKQI